MGTGIVVLREGFEASLVVGIVLAFLNRTGRRDAFFAVWIGVFAAIAISVGVGIALFAVGAELEGRAEYIFEGSAMLLAAGLLTWMIFWMRSQARTMRTNIEGRVGGALGEGSFFALAAVAFVGVLREGIETALFLFSSATGTSPLVSTISGIVGLGIALALGYGFYKGSSRLDLRRFFTLTSAILLLFAAWLLARGLEEFAEAGILPENEIVLWGTFLLLAAPTLWFFFRPLRRKKVPA
ncbi:MAG: FTR1 family protein [Thermoleophilia bacterium]|nr:FTR1 family protein [Thermoleophilia bacterium]